MIKNYDNWIKKSCQNINNIYHELDDLDQKIGDGDHGTTILKGLKEAEKIFKENIENSLDVIMSIVAKQMRLVMGGSSGILMSIFFYESGKINPYNISLSIVTIFQNTVNKIKKTGKVNVGDKSILDVYVPLLDYLNTDIEIDKNLDSINKIIKSSSESTINMEAKVGRAKFLEKKGLGIIDPGAYSTSIILKEFFNSLYK
ncbi:MAG: Dihydroxyacetone kinase [Alphaproteobacteria bacterium MarineAlpha5_Bin5]|nr:MAG: Dihydroxyacetone kinase [Alphaproteobacteria bacterium MarineAlpha5_Bin4]PPR49738.1 MAG: Dihydroxyacetone kinase [Alphaproteobacteria bacterium MarineAlpha5_Bin5]|tara:strand:- start:4344 stop:4946 length:603 start_codon:yes stop_codon:yes gene_type:complete